MNRQRPNILLFILHDLGDHLGCYGHQTVKSPNVDRLAADGVRLTSYFTASPECTPSRAGMMTGLYTHQNGLMGLCHRGWEFGPDAIHLAQRMDEGGYNTYLFGMQHETGDSPKKLGYKNLRAQQDRSAGPVCEDVVSFLDSESTDASPWYAHVGFFDVHRPWKEETTFGPDEIEVPPYLPDNELVREDLTHFHQNILETDEAVGRVLAAIEGSEVGKNTLVIFTTDHGCPFPRAKSTFYDPGIRIPLVMRLPGHYEGGRTEDWLLSNLDFTPTMLDIAGIDIPSGLEGVSFRGALEESGPSFAEASEGRDAVFGALYYDAFYDPMHYVRTRTHKYIRSFAVTEEDAKGAGPEVLAKHHTGTWIRADDSDVQSGLSWKSIEGTYDRPPPEELYDLEKDPLEQVNLAEDPASVGVLEKMRDLMREMMERSSSPLLTGHVSPDLSRTRNQRVSG